MANILRLRQTFMTVSVVQIAASGAKIVKNRENILQRANITATRSNLKRALVPQKTEAKAQVLASFMRKVAIAYQRLKVVSGKRIRSEENAIVLKEASMVVFNPNCTKN